MTSRNIHPRFDGLVSRKQQESLLNQKGKVLWFTGLSGSGKSTIAEALQKKMYAEGFIVQVLDGDNIRSGINSDLGFSIVDRTENIRRIAEVAKLFKDLGIIVLCSFVSPTVKIRQLAKDIIGEEDFIEVFIDTPLEECEKRDVKGLYRKARAGEIKGMTGIDSPFEIPPCPTLVLKTKEWSVMQCAKACMEIVRNN